MAKRDTIQPDAKKTLDQLGKPRRAVGVRSTIWHEGPADSVRVTATTCDGCDGRGYVQGAKVETVARGHFVVRFGDTKATTAPACVPCRGRGFVVERQRELGL